MGTEVVEHHLDATWIRVVLIDELAHLLDELDISSFLGHIDVPPTDQRFAVTKTVRVIGPNDRPRAAREQVAVDTDSKLLLIIDVFSRRGTDPAAAFLHRLTRQREVPDTGFTSVLGVPDCPHPSRIEQPAQLQREKPYRKWLQTGTMRIDRFPSVWRGSQLSGRRWVPRYREHYNHDRLLC